MVHLENYEDYECVVDEKDECDCKRCELTLLAYESDFTPWRKLYALEALRSHQKDRPFPDNKNNNIKFSQEPFDPDMFDWKTQLRSIHDIIQEHLEPRKGKPPKPNLCVLNESFHTWAFWQITGGRFIAGADKKRVWVLWNHRQRPITHKNIACLKHNKRDNYMWMKLPETPETLQIYYDIADRAQDLCNEYLRIVYRYCLERQYNDNTKGGFVRWYNCNNMPRIKAFRSDVVKDFDHKRYQWETGRVAAGGNQGYLPQSKPRAIPNIPYIHKMMQDYNTWVDRGRRRAPPKPNTITKFLET